VRQNLSVVLICISFMTKDVEYLCIYLSSIWTSENCLFNSFAHLLIGLFVLLLFNFFGAFIICPETFCNQWRQTDYSKEKNVHKLWNSYFYWRASSKFD
jgi:hypothetical protein